MTEGERNFISEHARFYNAQKEKESDHTNKKRRFPLWAAGASVLLLIYAFPVSEEFSSKVLDICGETARLSASIELMDYEAVEKIPENSSALEYDKEQNVNNNISIIPEDDILMISYGSRRMPSSENEEIPVTEEDVTGGTEVSSSPLPYPYDANDNDGAISRITYQPGTGENYIDLPMAGQLRNVTSLSAEEIYENAVMEPDFSIKLNAPADEPQVLIMHTHTTESYEYLSRDYYDNDFQCRTTDNDMNVTAVGDIMTKVFEENGIRTLHDKTIHDHPSYNGSYDRSRETVSALLEKYPSIKVVIDVHRDAIERESGERIAPYAEINGKGCAQVMLICGCDDGTMNMPQCMKNLRTASLFQQYMENMYPGLTRPVLYDYRQYNQDLTTGSLLLEVGGHANSIDEAVYAGQLSAEAIAAALKENCTE